jgi:hypothetical protein
MLRVGLVMMALSCSARAAPCVDAAKAYAQRDSAVAANEARFNKVLADRKLKLVTLRSVAMPANDDGLPPPGYEIGQVATAKDGNAEVTVVTDFSATCGDRPVELAQKGDKVFRVARVPKTGKSTVLEMCGCPSPQFTCGGAREVSRPIGYVLPANTTYGGVVTIEYVEDSVSPQRASKCPYVAPPP